MNMISASEIRETAATLLRDAIRQVSDPSVEPVRFFFDGREWQSQDNVAVGVAPRYSVAAGAAALWRLAPQCPEVLVDRGGLLRMAVAATDHLLAAYAREDGSLVRSDSPEAMFCGVELASVVLDLGDALDAERRARWTRALVRLVDFLIRSGNMADEHGWNPLGRNWYTNGNIELDELLLLELVRQVTADDGYARLYENQLAFVLDPVSADPRWEGFGLTTTREPTRDDGSDGAGFLAEAEGGTGRRGWDPDYTMFQASIAVRIFLSNRDPRLLRLMNMLLNQELPRVDTATWIINCTGGARRNNRQPFWPNALAVAAFQGGRADFEPFVPSHLAKIDSEYRLHLAAGTLPPGLWRGIGTLLPDYLRSAVLAAENH